MAAPTAKTIPTRNAVLPVAFTWAAGPTVADDFDWMTGDILLAWNTSVDTGYTITVVSKPKSSLTDLTITAFAIAFGVFLVFPRFGPQDEEVLSVVATNAAVKFARLSTKAQPAP